jgi:nitroreductase
VGPLEAIGSARAMRYLCSGPIPDQAVERLIWAATRASSARGSQPWQFVVLRDERVRAQFGELIRAAAHAADPLPPWPASRSDRLIDQGVRNLFNTLGQAPVIILVCGADIYPPAAPDDAGWPPGPAVLADRPQAGRGGRAPRPVVGRLGASPPAATA